ncbi:MAG: hypothetical protein QM725_01290 [Lacibacter sp.]
MRTIVMFLLLMVSGFTAAAGAIYIPSNQTDNVKAGKMSVAAVFNNMDVKTFLSVTPSKIQEMTGTKLSFGQKVSLRMAQAEVKRNLKKGKEIKMAEMGKKAEGGINFLWVLVGLVLGITGVLIAYLTREGHDDNRVRSAWIGFGISAIISIIFLVLYLSLWMNEYNYYY